MEADLNVSKASIMTRKGDLWKRVHRAEAKGLIPKLVI